MSAMFCVRSCNFRVYERYKERTQIPGNKRNFDNTVKNLHVDESRIYDLAD